MKDYQQRWNADLKNSVIASLMGFDELQPKPPCHEKRRGLSESYLRKSASIGLWGGSLVCVGRSCSVDRDDTVDRFENSRSRSVTKDITNSRTDGAPVSSSLFGSGYESRKLIGKNGEHCARRVLRCQQKLEYDSRDLGELGIDSQLETMDDIRRISTSVRDFKPSPGKVVCDRKDGEVDAHWSSSYRESLKSCKYEAAPRYGSFLAYESKKQKHQRWKTAKKVQEFGGSRRNQTLSEMLALADRISKSRTSGVKHGETGLSNPTSSISSPLSSVDDESRKSLPDSEFEEVKDILSTGWEYELIATENKSKEETASRNDNSESKSGKGSEQFQISLGVDETTSPGSKVSELSSCSFSCFGSAFNNPEAYILGTRDEMDNSFDNDFGKDDELTATVGVPSITSGDSAIEEASLKDFFEDELAYPNFSTIVPQESQENLKRINQHSPDSVLESFDIKSSSFEWLDSTGLRLQLESLNFDSGETCSDGSAMVISGDEDAEEESRSLCHDSRKVKRWLGDGESRTYSYMVDVLDEAGFCGMNSYMDLQKWYSLEYPVSPLVFETLEKKYGKQISWQKSERQLLFDRINSGLLEIFNPIINFHADTSSIRRRFCASFRLDEVVNELWTKLVSQEEVVSQELSKKAVDKWWELEEGVDIICSELEASLFDDLAMEFASLWD